MLSDFQPPLNQDERPSSHLEKGRVYVGVGRRVEEKGLACLAFVEQEG